MLRRILRRAARYGRKLGQNEPFLYKLVPALVEIMGEAFPELIARGEHCAAVIKAEEESFGRTLDRGIELFEEIAAKLQKAGGKTIAGADAFKLYDTFGFPARSHPAHGGGEGPGRRRGRLQRGHGGADGSAPGRPGKFGTVEINWRDLAEQDRTSSPATESLAEKARLVRVGETEDEYHLVFARTPFYAESGGQVGDTGTLAVDGKILTVKDTRKAGRPHRPHRGQGERAAVRGRRGRCSVDCARRAADRGQPHGHAPAQAALRAGPGRPRQPGRLAGHAGAAALRLHPL